jgi:hypothetical protein
MKAKKIVIIIFLYFHIIGCDEIGNSIKAGETHTAMNYHIAASIMTEYKQALTRYKDGMGTFPLNKNYCVPEELKNFLNIAPANTCCFLNDCNRSTELHRDCKDWYIAVGDWHNKIVYECKDGRSYRLWYYGQNGLNDDGKGDDMEAHND